MFLHKTVPFAACLALLLLLPCFTWAQSDPVAPAPSPHIISAPEGTAATQEAMQEWRNSTLQIVRKLESVSRTSTTYEAYKTQLAETKKELEVALKDAPEDVITFCVGNAMDFYDRASKLLQFAAESHNSAYVYRQNADGLLQIYVGKYKKVRRSDKLSERRTELVDAPLSKVWKEASDWLTDAQKWIDTPNK